MGRTRAAGAKRVDTWSMGVEYPDLPGWEFTTVRISPGEFRVRVVGPGGVNADSEVVDDPDDCIEDMRQWARRTANGGGDGLPS